MREPFLVMTLRRIPAALAVSAMLCGGASVALAQAPAQAQARPASPKPPKSEAKPSTPKPEAVKPETKPAAAGGAEPTLIGQFGTWGAYSAAPNGKKVCFALAKPTSSKTNPPNRPRDPAYAFVSTRPAERSPTKFRS